MSNIRDCRGALIAQLLLWLHSLKDTATSTASDIPNIEP